MGDQARPGFSDKLYREAFDFLKAQPTTESFTDEEMARLSVFFLYWAFTYRFENGNTIMEAIIKEFYGDNREKAERHFLSCYSVFQQGPYKDLLGAPF